MHLGKTEGAMHRLWTMPRKLSLFRQKPVCVIGRGLQAAVVHGFANKEKDYPDRGVSLPAIQSVLGSIELICRFNST